MKNRFIVPVVLIAMGAMAHIAQGEMKEEMAGKAEFDKYCSGCHANGGNKVNPAKPLNKTALEKNGVRSWKDGVTKMRNPGPGMTKFLKTDISDSEAKIITKYVLATFKY